MFSILLPFLLFPTLFASKLNLIIDTDAVADDLKALTIALNHPNINVIAITTVHGGVPVTQSTANVRRLLRAVGQPNIPIYTGSEDAMIPKGDVIVWEDLFGFDGIGGVPEFPPKVEPTEFTPHNELHAVDALINITNHHDNIVLVCLGPLTNLASAIRKDPRIVSRFDKVVIMGGSYMAMGNTRTNSSAEFNFLMDPEAAQVVLESVHTTIVPWDTCFFKGSEYADIIDFDESLKISSDLSQFLDKVTLRAREFNEKHDQYATFVDDVAIGVAINEQIATKVSKLYARVELAQETFTRGQVVIDWLSVGFNKTKKLFEAKEMKNDRGWLAHEFVLDYDVRAVNRLLIDSVTPKNRVKDDL